MKSLSKAELLFLSLLSICFLSSAALLYSDVFRGTAGPGGKPVGTIAEKSRRAEQKNAGSAIWSGVGRDSPVFNRDTIRTGALSTAVIKLNDDTSINLDEQSMVVIDMDRDAPSLRISGGSVTIASKPGAKPVTIKGTAGAKDVSVQDGSVRVDASPEGVTFRPADGPVRIKASGSAEPLDISGNTVYDLSTGSTRADTVLVSPAPGALLVGRNATSPVSFSWEAEGPRDLVIASDAAFRNVETSVNGAESGIPVNLNAGVHYWKILSPEGGTSPSGWFIVRQGRAPEPLSPIGTNIPKAAGPVSVSFSWTRTDPDDLYRIEISRKDNPAEPVVSRTVSQRNVTFDFSENGEYVWKVIAIAGPDRIEFPARQAYFTISDNGQTSPTLLVPRGKDKLQVSTLALQEGKPVASWQPVANALGYEVTISPNPAGEPALVRTETKNTCLTLKEPLPEGTVYVSVRARTESGLSPASGPVALEVVPVQDLSAASIVPAADPFPAVAGKPVALSWTDPNQGSRYRVIVSCSPDLSSPILDTEAMAPRYRFVIPADTTGPVYWKAELLGTDSRPLSGTRVSVLDVTQPIPPPVIRSPAPGTTFDINSTRSLKLEWDDPSGDQAYRVRFFRSVGGIRTCIRELETSGGSLVVTDLSCFSLDRFDWELTASSPETGGAASEPAGSWFRFVQKKPLAVPKIRKMSSRGGF